MATAQKLHDDLLSLFVMDSVERDNGLHSYLRRLLEVTARCFRTTGASIFLEEDGVFQLAAKTGPAARTPEGAVIKVGVGLAGEAIASGIPRIITSGSREDLGSSMVIPLMEGSHCFGVLNMARGLDEPIFADADLEVVEGVAGQIALAVHNARLFASAREVERLKRLAEVGQMTAAIAHEIRNPLTGIFAAVKMMREAPEMVDEMAQIIESETTKLNQLCDEFLDFARPMRLELTVVDLGELAQGLVNLLKSAFSEAGVVLESRPAHVVKAVDARRIEQALRNLLLNAMQATPKGGTVTIDVFDWGFSVQDTGAGMTEEGLAKIFSPFYTTKADGTGLGLSTARKIVNAHGGQLLAESREGEGTTFEVRLP